MAVSGSTITADIKSSTGFDFAIPGAPENNDWVGEVGSKFQTMWNEGQLNQAIGAPSTNPSPPPTLLPWPHTHGNGIQSMTIPTGSVGSQLAKDVYDAAMTAVKFMIAAMVNFSTGAGADGTLTHSDHVPINFVSAADLKAEINVQVDGISGIDRASSPDLQTLLDAIADDIVAHVSTSYQVATSIDSGDGTHVHNLS